METFVNNLGLYLNTSITLAFAAAFVGGVLTSFTPCVYPLIPITATYITSSNIKKGTKTNAFLLAFIYVTGVSIVYAGLGMFAAMTGSFFGSISTHPVTYFVVGNIILLLGLSMLDVFSIRLPSFMQTAGVNKKRKGLLGALLVGMASGLMVAPCTAPSLGVLLTFVATKQSFFLGASLLFTFAFGMGVLLIIVGTFSGILPVLPKSGGWMEKVKMLLAFIMFIIGEYYIFKAGQFYL